MIRPAIFSRLGDLLMEQEGRGARVARLLHDDVGPTLSAVGFHLHALGDVEGIGQVRTYLEEVMERVREASQRLHFNPVERSGLAMALERLGVDLRERHQLSVRFYHKITHRYPSDISYSLYRIIQLALENAANHAGCAEAVVRVIASASNFSASIADKGKGFDLPAERSSPSGTGLLLMEAYARKESFHLRVTTSAGKGTIVKIQAGK